MSDTIKLSTGFAAAIGDQVATKTVSDSKIGAIVNYLWAIAGYTYLTNDISDETLFNLWRLHKGDYEIVSVQLRKVKVVDV